MWLSTKNVCYIKWNHLPGMGVDLKAEAGSFALSKPKKRITNSSKSKIYNIYNIFAWVCFLNNH